MSERVFDDERILVPIDGSDASERAFEYALNFPAESITLLTVIDPFDVDPLAPGFQSPSGRPGMPGYSPEWYEKVEQKAEELHDRKRERADDRDITVKSEVTYGSPARQIVKYTHEHEIEHIVLGRKGQDSITRALLGSVSGLVVRRSSAIVTVIS